MAHSLAKACFLAVLSHASLSAMPQELSPGLTLVPPNSVSETWLLDRTGALVHTWPASSPSGLSAYLLENGNLLRTERPPSAFGPGGGVGGRVREMRWDGTSVWSFEYFTGGKVHHHDVEPLPNGNVLMIAWDERSFSEAVQAGRNPSTTGPQFWSDHIIEYDPVADAIVWEWYLFDHLIQDFDAGEDNFGDVGAHPERVDVNFPPGVFDGDWTHINGVDYNAELDQILLSVHDHNEIWIIDHSTTTAEAAGTTGGRSGRGGDLLYRWGNPQAYRAGTADDEILRGQHDANWVEPGYPGFGNIVLFNNNHTQSPMPFGPSSSAAVEFTPPTPDANGNYPLAPGAAYGPAAPVWVYEATPPESLYSANQGGAVRLANGNTLITSTNQGRILEVTSGGAVLMDVTTAPGAFKTGRYERALFPNGSEIEASLGGSVDLEIAAGSPFASRFYVVLGSASGTTPGIPVNGQVLPLNPSDFYFNLTLAGSGPISGNSGILDGLGRASSTFTLTAAPSLAGITLHHAVAVFDPVTIEVLLATNATELKLVP